MMDWHRNIAPHLHTISIPLYSGDNGFNSEQCGFLLSEDILHQIPSSTVSALLSTKSENTNFHLFNPKTDHMLRGIVR